MSLRIICSLPLHLVISHHVSSILLWQNPEWSHLQLPCGWSWVLPTDAPSQASFLLRATWGDKYHFVMMLLEHGKEMQSPWRQCQLTSCRHMLWSESWLQVQCLSPGWVPCDNSGLESCLEAEQRHSCLCSPWTEISISETLEILRELEYAVINSFLFQLRICLQLKILMTSPEISGFNKFPRWFL
jgi:hypothetical protein